MGKSITATTSRRLQLDPFGMITNGRSWQVGSDYRYGFNEQEQDDEVYGNGELNAAEYWEYDTRLGRRWNIDPIFKSWESPYAVFRDSPISVKDPDGDDGYVDENGNYLGDDQNKDSHDTRVVSASTWSNIVGKNTEIDGDMRNSLMEKSTLLTGYENSINITDETWQKLVDAGGIKLLPWLENNSDFSVFYKPENTSESIEAKSGEQIYYTVSTDHGPSGIDGFAAPHLRENEVFKVVTGTRVVIDNDNFTITQGPLNVIGGGYWKNSKWLDEISAAKIETVIITHYSISINTTRLIKEQYPDRGWINLFIDSGLEAATDYLQPHTFTKTYQKFIGQK